MSRKVSRKSYLRTQGTFLEIEQVFSNSITKHIITQWREMQSIIPDLLLFLSVNRPGYLTSHIRNLHPFLLLPHNHPIQCVIQRPDLGPPVRRLRHRKREHFPPHPHLNHRPPHLPQLLKHHLRRGPLQQIIPPTLYNHPIILHAPVLPGSEAKIVVVAHDSSSGGGIDVDFDGAAAAAAAGEGCELGLEAGFQSEGVGMEGEAAAVPAAGYGGAEAEDAEGWGHRRTIFEWVHSDGRHGRD